MQKGYPTFQSLLDKKCLSHTTSSIDSDKLWLVTMVESLQLFYFMFSSNNCTHNYLL